MASAKSAKEVCRNKRKPEDDLGGKRQKPIYEEVLLGVGGCTELMQCVYNLDIDCVQTALAIHDNDPANEDYDPHKRTDIGHGVRDYLNAGFSIELNRFFRKYKDSERMSTEKMTRKDREKFQSLFPSQDAISELLHKYGV